VHVVVQPHEPESLDQLREWHDHRTVLEASQTALEELALAGFEETQFYLELLVLHQDLGLLFERDLYRYLSLFVQRNARRVDLQGFDGILEENAQQMH